VRSSRAYVRLSTVTASSAARSSARRNASTVLVEIASSITMTSSDIAAARRAAMDWNDAGIVNGMAAQGPGKPRPFNDSRAGG
jgi:cystathionine beta-lyase/cystathionine gamma-synthase